MSYCLNPYCQKPQNRVRQKLCRHCGAKLVLREHYRALYPLAQGNFGRTFLAVDEDRLKTHCVIKQFWPQVQGKAALQKAAELFNREAEQLLKLGQHPQIPMLLASFAEDGHLYLVQEFIDGQNLLQELQTQGCFSEPKIQELLISLLPVLEFVHQHQVIHRDIKPANILRHQQNRQLVLVDFGVAKQNSDISIGKTGTITGTIGYAPIEQIRSGKAYPASDLYSLGITCIQLLTQVPPDQLFDPNSGELVWREHLIQTRKTISPPLTLILDKLLKDLVKERYQSAIDVLQDVLAMEQNYAAATHSTLDRGIDANLQAVHHLDVIVAAELEAMKTHINAEIKPPPLEPIAPNLLDPQSVSRHDLTSINAAPALIPPQTSTQNVAAKPRKLKLHKAAILHSHRNAASALNTPDLPLTRLQHPLTTESSVCILKGHLAAINAIAYAYCHHYTNIPHLILVSGSDDHTIKLWNPLTGQLLYNFVGHLAAVHSLAISPDGKILISGSSDRTILLWNLQTGSMIDRFYSHSGSPYSHRCGAISAVAISPDGRIIASGSLDKTIKLWNQRNGELLYKLPGHLAAVLSVAYAPPHPNFDANYPQCHILASGSADTTIKIWRVGASESLRTLMGHSGTIHSIAFSPNGQTLISGSADKTIKLWNFHTGELQKTLTGHRDAVFSVAISPNGSILASGSGDGTIKLWDLTDDNTKLLKTFLGYHPIAFSPNGQILVSGTQSGEVQIWPVFQ